MIPACHNILPYGLGNGSKLLYKDKKIVFKIKNVGLNPI